MTEALIRIECIGYGYTGQPALIQELSLEISRGERVCLLGRNGSGKSTLLKLMAGLLLPISGQVLVDGVATGDVDFQKKARHLTGFVFQNPEDQILSTTVEMDVAFALENQGVLRQQMQQRVAEMLSSYGLETLKGCHPLTLSAGEKQRTALAAMMITQPHVLLLDEPTSFLDYRGRQLLEEVVFENEGYTVIGATQFVSEVDSYDRVIFLEQGQMMFCGSRDDFKRSAYWQQISTGWPKRKTLTTALVPERQVAVKMQDVLFEYSSERQVLRQISVEILAGQITAIMGDSGCGKTTLALLLAGLVVPNSGSIWLGGKAANAKELTQKVAVMFQFPETSFFAESVAEEVMFGVQQMELETTEREARVRVALGLVELDFDKFAHRSPFQLSAGEQRRVAIASVLVLDRPVIVFDESTLGLDWEGRLAMMHLLTELKAAGKTIVLMTHDIDFARHIADHVVLMDQGGIVWQGTLDAADMPQQFLFDHSGVEKLDE